MRPERYLHVLVYPSHCRTTIWCRLAAVPDRRAQKANPFDRVTRTRPKFGRTNTASVQRVPVDVDGPRANSENPIIGPLLNLVFICIYLYYFFFFFA